MPSDPWGSTYDDVCEAIDRIDSDVIYFRGQSDPEWKLLPGLARYPAANRLALEEIAYFDFRTRAGDLVPETASGWSVLFAMQHHGLPTRLLDWTDTFSVALYFALKGAKGDCAVWLLNPFALNEESLGYQSIPRPNELGGTYEDFFIDRTSSMSGSVAAVAPLRHNPRVSRQRAAFTLHGDLESPMEELCPAAVERVVVSAAARPGAVRFLQMAGVSEFNLFPDLDGLARELRTDHFP